MPPRKRMNKDSDSSDGFKDSAERVRLMQLKWKPPQAAPILVAAPKGAAMLQLIASICSVVILGRVALDHFGHDAFDLDNISSNVFSVACCTNGGGCFLA